ncbi:MAG: 50S ribosomal protein L24 [Candidatus Magasanikbacteria bacterium CG10_big_fil_rev_8_21_14_0_10_36_16]|uniref:Large ribosomal subunit protein uL24 n=1 Tax=Candidatus Magasanikbacteria bacterium CG10_big_fil_rev_8_21_14_0_10_36_16 TaxID=1974645 RepID=A0A2H0TZ24_9BACT|nr:MAG: 50S ribosomal protein L24 [Candidatus Magasanikbacteria bacterium CG10_big_fil_rev_8_21_14_0_10_36_16]
MKIKTGDKVKILSGKDSEKTGKVLQVLKNKLTDKVFVVVEGANILKKHLRAGRKGEKGQIIELPAPIDMSNVMLIDSNSKKPTRVGYKIEGEEKKRVAKVSGEFID